MITIKDVAAYAGVAISTVSKVMNNYPNVSEETKIKVREAIKELNYVPNTIAATLSSKQSGRAAVIIDLESQKQAIDEISIQYLSGAMKKAMELNIEVLTIFFSMIKHMTSEEMIRYFHSQNITGMIICGMSKEDDNLKDLISSGEFKFVVIDAPFVNDNTSTVWIDNEKAQYDVAKKTILDNNCRKVLYIAGKQNAYITDERTKGMRRLADELGLSMLVKHGEFSELQARKLAFRYAKGKDVVVCASDMMAIGTMRALTEMDIFRPVCGFDGITLMGYVGKQMNSVRQNFSYVASCAVEELKKLYDGKKGENIVLDYEIVNLYYEDIVC